MTDRQSFTVFLNGVERELGLIDGVAGMPGMRNAAPKDIVAGTVGLIDQPGPRLIVTSQASVTMAIAKRLPLRLSEAVTRALTADRIFASAIDNPERRDSQDRARHR